MCVPAPRFWAVLMRSHPASEPPSLHLHSGMLIQAPPGVTNENRKLASGLWAPPRQLVSFPLPLKIRNILYSSLLKTNNSGCLFLILGQVGQWGGVKKRREHTRKASYSWPALGGTHCHPGLSPQYAPFLSCVSALAGQ